MEGQGATVWFHEFFRFGFYKRSQGRIARQATFGALVVIVVLGCIRLSEYFIDQTAVWKYYVPLALLAIGLWASFRVVQIPAFADFLISVEGEMNKVSWPSRSDLFRASIVVIVVIFFLAALLFVYDAALTWLRDVLDRVVAWMFG